MRTVSFLFVVLLSACATTSPAPVASPHRPQILVTDDDGIEAPGIAALAEALRPLGDVYVVAPKTDMSGTSHSITILRGTAGITPFSRNGSMFGHAVAGTPADSVLAALYWVHKDRTFDLVVSGINFGTNVGVASLYSGTVGATVEAAIAGIPAIAFSQDSKYKNDYTRSAPIAAMLAKQVLERGLPPHVFLNVNIPAGELKGIRVGTMGGSL